MESEAAEYLRERLAMHGGGVDTGISGEATFSHLCFFRSDFLKQGLIKKAYTIFVCRGSYNLVEKRRAW